MPPRKSKAAAATTTAPAAASASTSKRSSRGKKASSPEPVDASSDPLEPTILEAAVGTLVETVGGAMEGVESVVGGIVDKVVELANVEVPTLPVEAILEAGEKAVDTIEKLAETEIPSAKEVAEAVRKGKGKAREEEFVESGTSSTNGPKLTIQERQQKLKELRLKMNASSAANRKDLISEHQKNKTSSRELAHLEKNKRLAESMREKADAEETGEDLERNKVWGWSIEDNERWEKKIALKEEGANKGFVDEAHSANNAYTRLTNGLKPDLQAYNRQKELALNLAPGTLTSASASSSAQSKALARMKPMTSDDLYRDANSLSYANNKPSEEAIDNMVSKLNVEIDSRSKSSRKRANDDEGDVTYINDANKVFNKKITRYYDKYTKEIRANFERGTAL
ncbi:SYF2 splicing factor-domain-containing protein [Mrakia frigida]|uniref:Syf2p n=1 Tax=Mrakia frigida TaxID=29902 RepID=UPI003FCC05B9